MLRLETSRLILRPLSRADVRAFSEYRSDPEIARYQGWGTPFTEEQAGVFIDQMQGVAPGEAGQWLQLGMELRSNGGLIGDVAFQVIKDSHRQAEIGMTLSRSYQKQGFGFEAVSRLMDYLIYDLNVHRVIANCDPENHPAHRLLERVGFRREGLFVESLWYKGDWASELWFALLEREWKEKRSHPME